MVINIFDPDVIILGASLARLDRLYQNVPRKWPGYLLVERNETKLQKTNHTSFRLAKGAASLATDPAITPSMAIAISN
jgi:fructokinase